MEKWDYVALLRAVRAVLVLTIAREQNPSKREAVPSPGISYRLQRILRSPPFLHEGV